MQTNLEYKFDIKKSLSKQTLELDLKDECGLHIQTQFLDLEASTMKDLDTAQTVSQYGYMLGVPSTEDDWTSSQDFYGNEDFDIDPHYAFFGCNTDSEVLVFVELSDVTII